MSGGFQFSSAAVGSVAFGAVDGSTTVIAPGSANTKGSWRVLGTPTQDCIGLIVQFNGVSANNASWAVDIGIGATGSEIVLIPNVYYEDRNGGSSPCNHYFFPVAIPAGVQLSARCQSSLASSLCDIQVIAVGDGPFGGDQSFANCQAYGLTLSGNTLGTLLDGGATANTKGAYAQLVASTTYDARAVCFGFGNNRNITTDIGFSVDFAVGASGSEQVLVPNMALRSVNSMSPFEVPLFVNIPAGSRLAARCSCQTNNATNRICEIVAYLMS